MSSSKTRQPPRLNLTQLYIPGASINLHTLRPVLSREPVLSTQLAGNVDAQRGQQSPKGALWRNRRPSECRPAWAHAVGSALCSVTTLLGGLGRKRICPVWLSVGPWQRASVAIAYLRLFRSAGPAHVAEYLLRKERIRDGEVSSVRF